MIPHTHIWQGKSSALFSFLRLSQPVHLVPTSSSSLIILLSVFFPLSSLSPSSLCCLPFFTLMNGLFFQGTIWGALFWVLGREQCAFWPVGSMEHMRRIREQRWGDRHLRCPKRQLCHEGYTNATGRAFVAWSEFSQEKRSF